MPAKNIYDTMKQVIQDVVSPEIREITGELKLLHTEIRRLDEKLDNTSSRLDEKLENTGSRLDEKLENMREDIRNLREEFRLAIDIHERLAAVEAKVSR